MWLGTAGKVAAAAALISSCSSLVERGGGKCHPRLQTLANQVPEAKAEASVASNKVYLLGVRGYVISFPGANEDLAARIGYRILEGTSDAFEDESCRAYQRQAEKYAERFNRRVLELIPMPPS